MDPQSLPHWAQAVFYLVIAIGAGSTGLLGYFRKKAKEDASSPAGTSGTAQILSASFIDSKLLKELIESLRELQDERSRDDKKSHRLLQDLRDSMNNLNETVLLQTDATANLVRFVNRDAARHKETL